MKHNYILIILTFLFTGIIQFATAQNSWLINYRIESSGGSGNISTSVLDDAEAIFAFDDDLTYYELSMDDRTHYSGTSNGQASLILIDAYGVKLAVPIDAEDLKKNKGSKNNSASNKKIIHLTGNKDIAGYDCKHAKIKTEDHEFYVWYTDKIRPQNTNIQITSMYDDLDGFPLQFSIDFKGLPLKFTATQVSCLAPDEIFSMDIPDGYTKMSYDAFKLFGGK